MTKMQKWSKVSKIFVLVLVCAFIVSACGSNQAGTNGNGQEGAQSAAEPTANTTQSANEEEAEDKQPSGKVVIYSAGPGGLAENIVEGFKAETGLEVEQFQATTGKILARLEAEKNNPVADVVVLASWPSGMALKNEGATQSYTGAAQADKLYETWVDEERHLFGYSASALGITYNTKLVDEPPTDWSDFADPQWKDAVNIPDPSLSGSALDFISGYLNQHGDKGWDMFEELKNNGVALAGANKEALNPVITGAKSAVMAGVDYMAYSAIAKGEPVGIVSPASGTVINPRPAMILKEAPNVENAQLFIDYLLSDEAQGMVAAANLLPGRSDIRAHEDRTQVADIKLLEYDWDWMMEQGPAITNDFLELYK